MAFYIILFFCLVFGVLLGLFEGFKILKPKEVKENFVKDQSRSEISAMQWDDEAESINTKGLSDIDIKSSKTDNSEVLIEKTRTLREKLDARTSVPSMVEFNCLANQEDYQSKLHQNRDREDDAYNVIKSSKKNGKLSSSRDNNNAVYKVDIDQLIQDEIERETRQNMQFNQDTTVMAEMQIQQQFMQNM